MLIENFVNSLDEPLNSLILLNEAAENELRENYSEMLNNEFEDDYSNMYDFE